MTAPVFPVNPLLVAGPGTIVGLHEAVKARMTAIAARFDGFLIEKINDADAGGARAPSVLDGWLPPKANAGDKQFPFILVRPRQGTDTEQSAEQNATAQVDIIVGTWSDDDAGWLDVALVIDAIRQDLDEQPAIQATGFEQTGPLTWEIPEEQPRPQWFGKVHTVWTIPRPQRVEARNPEEG